MTNVTRYLCAAAYLDEGYTRKVIRELVDEPYRAVVPSYGFDIGPIIGHCLRARRLHLIRDFTIWALLIGCAVVSPFSVSGYVALTLPFTIGRLIPWRRFGWRARFRLAMGITIAYFVFSVFVGIFITTFVGAGIYAVFRLAPSGLDPGTFLFELIRHWIDPLWFVLWQTLLWLGVLGIAYGWQIIIFRKMRTELRPGMPTPPLDVLADGPRRRTRHLVEAQMGDVTMYSKENPFIGSGAPDSPWAQAWSIVAELDRPAGPDKTVKPVQPVDLHEHVRRHLMGMAEEWPEGTDGRPDSSDSARRLPANERIAGLNVGYHVVARGTCAQYPRSSEAGSGLSDYQGHPLVDPVTALPYSKTTDESCEAIIRHPQGGIRCYQRVTVGAEGQAIRDSSDGLIAPAEDQDVVVSVFIHLAVEGHMLYAQFVADVLPPVRRDYQIVDRLPSCTDGSLVWMAIRRRWLAAFSDGVMAPFRVVQCLFEMAVPKIREGARPTSYTMYDYGARLSVREMAAEETLPTYLQVLDAHKYSRLIERRLNEAVLDYLQSCDIDVSAYRRQADQIVEQSLMIGGNNYGPINTGSGRQDNRGTTIARW